MATRPAEIDFDIIPTPTFLINERRVVANLEVLSRVSKEAGVTILAALKAFTHPWTNNLIAQYLSGYTASSEQEARFARAAGGDLHIYAPAIKEKELENLIEGASHVTFNSLNQLSLLGDQARSKSVSVGIRINPEYSEVETAMYNPTDKNNRLGVLLSSLDSLPSGVDGIHIHALCENDSFVLERLISHLEENAAHLLKAAKWINLGGGHLISKADYDVEHLIGVLAKLKADYDLEVILEPGAAVVYEAGYLVSEVVDVIEREKVDMAMLDVSFSAHMPDCLEMPYKPFVVGAINPNDFFPTYDLGGNTCLAGDQLGQYSFIKELKIGDRVIFFDMLHYTMVKTTRFNGVQHPSIAVWKSDDTFEMLADLSHQVYPPNLD